ncbi:MAG: hypothetical protein KAT58_10090 [candidate division Zixibacteria bacterium]|nr:hypothetical protein [candidate division Zixibacteria bacterium]
MMPTKHMSRFKTLAFGLIPVLVFLLILEVIGRIVYPIDREKRARIKAARDPRAQMSYLSNGVSAEGILTDIRRMECRYLPFLGWLGAPDVRLPTIETNELGFRDRPIELPRAGEVRIVILGGSTVWSLGASSNAKTVVGQLERLLNGTGTDVTYRVMSGAFLGWTSRKELIALMEFQKQFAADLVLAVTGYNDFFVLSSATGLDTRPEARMLAKAVEDNLRPMSTLRALRKVAGSLGIWRIVLHFRELSNLTSPRRGRVTYDEARAEAGVEQVVDRYATMAAYAARHGARLMIAVQPEIYTTGKRLSPEEQGVRDRFIARTENIDAVIAQYRADLLRGLSALNRHGVKVVDLGGVLDAVDEPVFIDACHFNDVGYEVLAKALLPVIMAD